MDASIKRTRPLFEGDNLLSTLLRTTFNLFNNTALNLKLDTKLFSLVNYINLNPMDWIYDNLMLMKGINYLNDFTRMIISRVFCSSGDALTFTEYSKYDVIYFYCPIADDNLERQLEKKIADDTKVGTVVIGFLPRYFCESQLKQWKQVGENSWKKIDA